MAPQKSPKTAEQAGITLAAFLRNHLPGRSWAQIRRLIESRRVRIEGELCLDPARRLREGLLVEILDRPAPRPAQHEAVKIVYLDQHLVVVEKPTRISTFPPPVERDCPPQRKTLSPPLEHILPN